VKTYADQLSSRLIVHGKAPADLRELELELEREVFSSSKPEPLAASQVAVPHERARSRVQVDEIGQAVLGALLDFPELFGDPEVAEALEGLEGDTALAVGAMRQHFDREASMVPGRERSEGADQDKPTRIGIYSDEFLAQIPRSVHSFAVGRVAAPAFEVLADAKLVLLDNARKLKCLGLKREKAAVVEELTQKAEAQGDVESEDALLREVGRLAMEKRGRGRGR
jgi:DNA primase